jgi:hypothetical protein
MALDAAINAAGRGNFYLGKPEDYESPVIYKCKGASALESFIAELTVQGLGDLIAPASASSSKVKSMMSSLTMGVIRVGRGEPSIWELARLYPEFTYVHTISRNVLDEEVAAINRALVAGYPKADRIQEFETISLAVGILISDLQEVADYQSIHHSRWDYTFNQEGDLEITFVFGNTPHAVLFKMASSLL